MSWLQALVLSTTAVAAMRAALERGDFDEAARQGALAGPAVVEDALGSPDRATRLAAIAAAEIVQDRAELLGPLARAAAGSDRRTAIPAAHAAAQIARELAGRGRPDDIAADDVAIWRAAWSDLALRGDRWIELRIAALDVAAALDAAGIGVDLGASLADPDPAFRRAAVAAIALPVPEAARAALAGTVVHDIDALTALAAAQGLCLSTAISAPGAVLATVAALGPPGLARLRTLVSHPPGGASPTAVRDAGRCLSGSAGTSAPTSAPASGPGAHGSSAPRKHRR